MFGRERIVDRICKRLTKDTPDNVTIVGPKRTGKTVLLSHLVGVFDAGQESYLGAAYLDLRHETPDSDDELLLFLCKQLANTVARCDKVFGEELRSAADGATAFKSLMFVFESLSDEDKRVLVALDAFDSLSIGTRIMPNVLDKLRVLAQQPSFGLVTCSRRPLSDICRTEESRGSDFWLVFADIVWLETFGESDWPSLLKPFEDRNIVIRQGVQKELVNWTGGIPVFTAALLRQLYETSTDGSTIEPNQVVDSAAAIASGDSLSIRDLWEDCTGDLQNLITDCLNRTVKGDELTHAQRRELERRGFAGIDNNTLSIRSRMLEAYAQHESPCATDISRLFRNEADFIRNMQHVLELRLNQIPIFDASLTRYVRYAINDLSDDVPNRVFDSARGISEEATRVMWVAEGLDGLSELPPDWLDTWTKKQNLTLPDGMSPLPTDRGKQVRVIRHIAGCTDHFRRVGSVITRHSVMLLEQVRSASNFRNHNSGEESHFGAACSLCLVSIELLASLANDLGAPTA